MTTPSAPIIRMPSTIFFEVASTPLLLGRRLLAAVFRISSFGQHTRDYVPLKHKLVTGVERALSRIRAEHELPNQIRIRASSENGIFDYLEAMFDA
jgi:hypothetical protein